MRWIFFTLAATAFIFLVRRIESLPRRLLDRLEALRTQKDAQAQALAMEAAARKVGPLIAGIRSYHDQMAASLRAQLADAELRARLRERRDEDGVAYLSAASKLVGELRALYDARRQLAGANESTPEPVEPDQRATIELRRPGSSTMQVQSSGEPYLSSDAALRAAGLLPRPASGRFRAEPKGAPVHPVPADRCPDAPERASSLMIDTGDSGEWLLSERPSDPEGERTRVGPQPMLSAPPPARVAPTATLPWMSAVRSDVFANAPDTPADSPETSAGELVR